MAMQCFVLKHNHEIFILEVKNSLCSQLLTLYRGSSHIMVSNPVLFQWPEMSNFPVLLFVVLLLLSSSDTLSFALLIFVTYTYHIMRGPLFSCTSTLLSNLLCNICISIQQAIRWHSIWPGYDCAVITRWQVHLLEACRLLCCCLLAWFSPLFSTKLVWTSGWLKQVKTE